MLFIGNKADAPNHEVPVGETRVLAEQAGFMFASISAKEDPEAVRRSAESPRCQQLRCELMYEQAVRRIRQSALASVPDEKVDRF
jgi:hypothetical protein